MIVAFAAVALIVVAAMFGVILAKHRDWAYRRDLAFGSKYDYAYDFADGESTAIVVQVDGDGFTLPNANPGETAFLELRVRATLAGRLLDPTVEVSAGSNRDTIFLERGARGLRHIDVSRVLGENRRIRLKGTHLHWTPQLATVRFWSNRQLAPDDRILVVAPHPDDAEIAAHALYAGRKTNVVTISAGDKSRVGLARIETDPREHAGLAARIRAWNSLTVPWLAGVTPEDVVQLAYPDGRLGELFDDPDRPARCDYDRASVRRMNRASIALVPDGPCTWDSLVADLRAILFEWAPTVVVVPFPKYDNHPDHGFTSLAVCEAMHAVNRREPRILMYINHSLGGEAWPFGPAGAGLSLPPNRDGAMPVHGLWSFATSRGARREKALALHAMHDLRDITPSERPSFREVVAHVRGSLGAAVRGTDRVPNHYFRRAIRSSELFFVVTPAQLDAISADFVRECVGWADERQRAPIHEAVKA